MNAQPQKKYLQLNLHELFFFTGRCLALESRPGSLESIRLSLSEGRVSLQDLIVFCDAHLVLPPLWLKMKKHGLASLFPPELRQHLEEIYLMNSRRNSAILQQMEEISLLLQSRGIEPVFLKGAAHLVDGLYSDAGERLIGDIDLLVGEDKYSAAAGLLMDSGYINPIEVYWEVSALKHFYPLYRGDRPAPVEVHQSPVEPKSSGGFSAAMVFGRKKRIAGRENCYVPCDEHKMIHNFIHGQITNGGWRLKNTSLRDIYDLHLLSDRVRPENLLAEIEEKEKARGYFIFSGKALGREEEFCHTESRKAVRHCRLSILALKHPRMHNTYRRVLLLSALIFKTYLGSLVKAIYRRESRKYLKSRLTAPGWYKLHLAALKRKFFC